MKKTDRKLDNKIIKALTIVCEDALDRIEGFQWLTHAVNYDQFPASLKVTCVFDDEWSLQMAIHEQHDADLVRSIDQQLKHIDVVLKNPPGQVSFVYELDSKGERQKNSLICISKHL